ncbi:hypothetical protein KY333_01860 [Candidatus Woesearchaeota archaeon]|nr:hypothetical protein [Candidatus Woesearchaeota archaeon]MBW2993861.1 hypothetical protein [Candidatus Woesearchaeota archaeon]
MEEKRTALVVLGVIVIIAIFGLVLMFKLSGTGGVMVQGSKTYANTRGNPFPYYQDALHSLPIQSRQSSGQTDWDWRTAPDHTYGAKMGRCAILATPEIGKVPPGYILDSRFQESQGRDCIRVQDSQDGYCCKLNQ